MDINDESSLRASVISLTEDVYKLEATLNMVDDMLKEPFDVVFEAYSKPADAFSSDEAWAIWQHGKVIKAFSLLQKLRTQIKGVGV